MCMFLFLKKFFKRIFFSKSTIAHFCRMVMCFAGDLYQNWEGTLVMKCVVALVCSVLLIYVVVIFAFWRSNRNAKGCRPLNLENINKRNYCFFFQMRNNKMPPIPSVGTFSNRWQFWWPLSWLAVCWTFCFERSPHRWAAFPRWIRTLSTARCRISPCWRAYAMSQCCSISSERCCYRYQIFIFCRFFAFFTIFFYQFFSQQRLSSSISDHLQMDQSADAKEANDANSSSSDDGKAKTDHAEQQLH